MNSQPTYLLVVSVIGGLMAVVGVILKQSLRHSEKKRAQHEPYLPYQKRA